jgi:hypothetical protein
MLLRPLACRFRLPLERQAVTLRAVLLIAICATVVALAFFATLLAID